MKYRWGTRSMTVRAEIHEDIVIICDEVLGISPFDLSLTEGRRGQAEQHEHFLAGRSELDWPAGGDGMSKHNRIAPDLSDAVHIDPYPIDYVNTQRYYILAGMMMAVAQSWDLKLRWLGLTTLRDLAHWEIAN